MWGERWMVADCQTSMLWPGDRTDTPPQSKKWKTNNKPVNVFMLLQRSISVNVTDLSSGWKFDEFHFKNVTSLLWVSGFGLHVVFESCKIFWHHSVWFAASQPARDPSCRIMFTSCWTLEAWSSSWGRRRLWSWIFSLSYCKVQADWFKSGQCFRLFYKVLPRPL